MQEQKTIKVHVPINETLDETVFETVHVDVVLNFDEEVMIFDVDGCRGIRTTLTSFEIDAVDGVVYHHCKGYFKSDEFLKYVEEAINE